MSSISADELQRRIEIVREVPSLGPALLLCKRGEGPVCELCGGRSAPIVGGRHLDPEKWCER